MGMRTESGKRITRILTVVLVLLGCLAWAQQELPDAPKPQNNVPPPQQSIPDAPASQPAPTSSSVPPTTTPASEPRPAEPPANEPMPAIATVPAGGASDVPPGSREQLFTLTKNVNFVMVPVSVKDGGGNLVAGLLKRDFSIYEDGVKQNISFFTSDPFPLSAAVVLDTGMPDVTWRKVRDTMSALVGAFSQYDEVAVYSYGNTVQRRQYFTGINAQILDRTMKQIKKESGQTGGVPVVGGPFGSGPTINGRPVDPSSPRVQTMPKESHVLNDAILMAAQDLAKRDPTRRRVLFVISDGRELGSNNGYADVLRILLSRQITVYAVGVSGAGIPLYRDLQKLRLPGQGYGNILPKYASATGGQVYPEIDQRAIEDAYSRVTSEARNQYTIGYNARATASSTYRGVEVRVHRPDLRIYARDGYYPMPPGR
jgi:VWFA-related protein